MAECQHCKGTGVAPNKITLECIGCQKKVVVSYTSSSEIVKICESVRCADCKKLGDTA